MESFREYEEAIKRNPSEAKYYFNKAMCYIKLMDWFAATKGIIYLNKLLEFDKCINLNPNYKKVWTKKGNAHLALKEYHKCLECFERAIKEDPTD